MVVVAITVVVLAVVTGGVCNGDGDIGMVVGRLMAVVVVAVVVGRVVVVVVVVVAWLIAYNGRLVNVAGRE